MKKDKLVAIDQYSMSIGALVQRVNGKLEKMAFPACINVSAVVKYLRAHGIVCGRAALATGKALDQYIDTPGEWVYHHLQYRH